MTGTPTMISGHGKHHTNTPTNNNPRPLLRISLADIRALVDNPQQVDKDSAQWFIPSFLESRIAADQERDGEYWALWADLDDGEKSVPEVYDAMVCRIVGAVDFEVYSSRSATPECPKARIIVPLDQPLRGGDWVLAQEVLNDKLAADGVSPDRKNQGVSQVAYLPNRGALYESRSERTGVFFDPMAAWSKAIESKRLELHAATERARAGREAAALRRASRLGDDGQTLVAAFNDGFTIEEVLLPKGYAQRGESFRHPNSKTGSYSATVKDGRIHALSPNDPLYTSGKDGKKGAHDLFSAFVVTHHNGDMAAALKDAGDNWVKINDEPWNRVKQREWAQAPENRVDRTDLGNVAVLARQVAGNLRFVTELKTWLWWDGERWTPDKARTLTQNAAVGVGEYYRKLADDQRQNSKADGLDTADRKRLEKVADSFESWAAHCRNKRGLDAMLSLAQSDARFVLSIDQLDQNPHLFGVANGVIDLRTGQLRPAGREDFVTKASPIAWVPGAKAPRWEQFIREITSVPDDNDPLSGTPRPDLAQYLQRMSGYCLTGLTREHKLFLAIGAGSNGKNVLFDLVREIMGSYSVVIQAEALMTSKYDTDAERPTPGARTLAGARLAVASESKETSSLDTNMVKRLVGEKTLTARALHENPFQFQVSHKLVLMSNHKPRLDSVDDAVQGRIHMIPFSRQWNRPGHPKRDRNLPDGDKDLDVKLRNEVTGVLVWLVAGAVKYFNDGLEPPSAVVNTTQDYLQDQDPFQQWLGDWETCSVSEGTLAARAHDSFMAHCNSYRMPALSQTAFSEKLKKAVGVGKKVEKGMRYPIRRKPDFDLTELNADLF